MIRVRPDPIRCDFQFVQQDTTIAVELHGVNMLMWNETRNPGHSFPPQGIHSEWKCSNFNSHR